MGEPNMGTDSSVVPGQSGRLLLGAGTIYAGAQRTTVIVQLGPASTQQAEPFPEGMGEGASGSNPYPPGMLGVYPEGSVRGQSDLNVNTQQLLPWLLGGGTTGGHMRDGDKGAPSLELVR